MLEHYDHTELLSLIEGDADARTIETLRARLSRDPQAMAVIESMRRDRASIRSIDEPALPQDFLAAIEPMLSRPMLIEPVADLTTIKPGEFRRQQRRRTRGLRIGRLAAAAIVVFAVSAGVWALIQNWDELRGRGTDSLLATGNPADAATGGRSMQPTLPRDVRANAISERLGAGTVHHDLRPDAGKDLRIVAHGPRPNDAASNDPRIATPAATPQLIHADFAVVLRAASSSAAETTVAGALADLGERAALVRNFSFDEAQRLAEEYRIAHGGENPIREDRAVREPMMASIPPGSAGMIDVGVSSEQLRQLATSVREQLRLRTPAGDQTTGSTRDGDSDLLAGAAALSPTLEQQLEYSSRGASHTIAVPASELVDLIERLALGDPAAGTTSLRMIPAGNIPFKPESPSAQPPASEASAMLAWLTEGPMVRQALQRLSQAPSDSIVLLPVIVR